MQICTTINLFNIFYLDELAQHVKTWNPDFWYINILHHPVEFDIQQIPNEIKEQIVNKLKTTTTYQQEIQTAIDYINGEPSYKINNWKKALTDKVKVIDSVRQENFADTFKILNSLLRIYD